jgi:hypothetical protein
MNLGTLVINKVIIHEVPKKFLSDQNEPILSEIESGLNTNLTLFFREKIIESAGSKTAFQVVFDPSSQIAIPGLIQQYLASPGEDFVSMSQQIARHLHDCQTRVNSGGLLTIIDCTIDSKRSLAVLKVEKEDGVRLNQSQVNGKRTFNIQHLRDLLLTKHTKLFKIGLFVQTNSNLGDVDGLISDYQRGAQTGIEVARFFLQGFLGCKLKEDPAVTTKRFYDAAEGFINTEIDEAVERQVAHTHLVSQMLSQSAIINPEMFAREYLPTPLRQKFINTLAEKDLQNQAFDKNIAMIERRIKKTALEFASGITVLGGNEAIGEIVILSDAGHGKTRLEMEDVLKKVVGK